MKTTSSASAAGRTSPFIFHLCWVARWRKNFTLVNFYGFGKRRKYGNKEKLSSFYGVAYISLRQNCMV